MSEVAACLQNMLENLIMICKTFRGTFVDYEDADLHRPVYAEREWKNNDFTFDNVGKAMLSLFAISTFEGWPQ